MRASGRLARLAPEHSCVALPLAQRSKDAADVHQDGGRDAFDVRLRLLVPLTNKAGTPLELESLTCKVQLLVPGQGSVDGSDTLVVPTTAKGARKVKVESVKKGSVDTTTQPSVKA